MSSKYDKTIQLSREEEGSYHRREIETSPSRHSYKQSRQLVSAKGHETSDEDNFEEWTVSKRKVNHKTRQVETRVSRQLLLEDGKVIADSGPQVTTRIKEDNKVEECEKEKAPKNKAKFDEIADAPEGECIGRVLGEKKEVQRVSHEVREENMQYHDERFKELTGHDVHRKAIQAPHELITITDKDSRGPPRGKMVHYSNKGKKYQDTNEILEVAKLAKDGSITKEVKRTNHHEEFSEDEKPDETGEAEALRNAPTVTRSSRRYVDYVNDFDDTDDEHHGKHSSGRQHSSRSRESKHKSKDDEAFPRYQIDPLLNSLRDEDFKPASSERHSGRYKHHTLERKNRLDSDDSDNQRPSQHRYRSPSPASARGGPVEIPEEYQTNRQRLLSNRGRTVRPRDRSFSPTNKSHLSQTSHRSTKSHREDAAVQAHLTDEEEEERKSMRSSSSGGRHSHEKTTKYLQRQSTANSHRNYYFGDSRRRAPSVGSASSSSLSDPKEELRRGGARSKDSGFRSPYSMRSTTPISAGNQHNQIYSVSTKSKKHSSMRDKTASPTPTAASLGQRSVKTTTTTVSAGLADRPNTRNERSTTLKSNKSGDKVASEIPVNLNHYTSESGRIDEKRRSPDNISLASSLGPNATTIQVPYRIVRENDIDTAELKKNRMSHSLDKNIKNLKSRLDKLRGDPDANKEKPHFNYRTIIETVNPAPVVPKQHVVGVYSVKVIEHNSPFHTDKQVKSMSELSDSIARLECSSSGVGGSSTMSQKQQDSDSNLTDNNNETTYTLEDYVKQKALPSMAEKSKDSNNDSVIDDDQVSVVSFRSSRTYDVRNSNQDQNFDEDELNDERDFPVEVVNDLDELPGEDEKHPAAWVFDIRDGSSKRIVVPPRPKKEEPRVEARTEDLGESSGGRSYYLELIEPTPRRSSIDSVYSRWNSHNSLNTTHNQRSTGDDGQPSALELTKTRKSRQIYPASILNENSRSINSKIPSTNAQITTNQQRQLPFSGSFVGNKSKSSSCLVSSTKPTKYSIYGGLKAANGENKPVPRLSYSRAIGPKSQRQIDAKSKTPSRYLKMK